MQILVVISLVWHVAETALADGNYLAYFNFIAGGPDEGYKHLVDSSLDWGQELGNLKRWLDDHASELPPAVYVSYFGTTPPEYYGLDARFLPAYLPISSLEPERVRPVEIGLEEGIYCISATSLQCVYNGNFTGPWRVDSEQNFRLLSGLMLSHLQNKDNPEHLAQLLAQSGFPNWNIPLTLFEQARFGRLCEYLRRRDPDDSVNHAILIYRLTKQDLKEAFLNPPVERYPKPEKDGQNVPY
jgi:hypothetical protein